MNQLMGQQKRRGGYLATAEGVKKLKEAKRIKKYTYEKIKDVAHVTQDQVKRLFNPQWGNGQYKIGEEAVEAICGVLDLQPEEIVSDWYPLEISPPETVEQESLRENESNLKTPNTEVVRIIKKAAEDGVETLNLSSMGLTELPAEIGQLTNLTELNLGSNSLKSLPPQIGQLTKLTTKLDLGSNSLSSLPPQIGQLTKLTTLDLSSNSLNSLPPEIGQLTNLIELNLYSNSLNSLPPEIGRLTELTTLDLSSNSLSSLPPEIGQLTNLIKLNLSYNSLRSLPLAILKFSKLTVLDLSYNSITSLPSEIVKLTNLKELYLSGNSITSLPSEIVELTNLKELYLYNNSIKSLPSKIGKLKKLINLDIGINALSNLPPEIGQLINLKELSLTENALSNLPPEIGQLTNLTRLDLSENALSNLPSEIGQLTNLTRLDLRGNSLPIPPEILNKDYEPATIINYYLSLQSNQKKPLNEAKMLLVGQGSVGKTCLKERLIRNQYDPLRNKTDGIDIESWNIEIDEREIQVNVWDFGGQEIMHSTHQFFLTKRSLYLLVLDATIREEENRIEYWLKIIQSFGKDSPVIIVGNKADQHPLDIDQRGLQKKYPQIKAFMETSCATEMGIKALQEVVTKELSQLEHIDDQLPLAWFNIKKQLEDLDKDYISYDQYESICKTKGVKEEDNQSTLIQFLHDLGVVLNFKDNDRLRDTHVLNPEWVTNGVYKILNDHQLIIEHRGILDRKILPRILDHDRYPQNKHLFIIDMMRKFELCFDVEPDQKFLIADILPKEEPYTGEWDKTLAFEYHYLVLPGSIISRFIVRMNHYIHQKTYWRSGVVLANEGNTALVKADREDKKIIIRVKGKENTRRNLLTAIRSQFDYIHKTIPGIIPEEKVPLIDHPEIVLDYQGLLGLEAMGEPSIAIGKLRKRIPLKQLLDGIEESSKRKKEDRDSDL